MNWGLTSKQKSLSLRGISLYLIFFSLSLWGIYHSKAYLSHYQQIFANLGLVTVLTCFYLFILNLKKKPDIKIKYSMVLIVLCTVCSPIVLQTDPFRYVWDGLHSMHGINPYRFAPSDSPWISKLKWAKQINHPHLPSIYPPAAQFFFHISAYLNPWQIDSNLDNWRLMFGWKLLVGLASAILIYCFQKKRWDYILLHPLFLMTVTANAHLDSLLIAAVTSFLCMKSHFRSMGFKTISLATAILCKWLPLLYLPGNFIYTSKRFGISKSIGSNLLVLIFTLFACSIYAIDQESKFFYSLGIYAQHWIFFPYIHAGLSWIFEILGFSSHIFLAKLGNLVIGGILACFLSLRFWQERLSFQLYLLLLSTTALALSPTLHPWYLLILLPLGMPYFKILLTPWIWPIAGLYSQSYYLYDRELLISRLTVYGLVSVCLAIDLKKLYKKLKPKPELQKTSQHSF